MLEIIASLPFFRVMGRSVVTEPLKVMTMMESESWMWVWKMFRTFSMADLILDPDMDPVCNRQISERVRPCYSKGKGRGTAMSYRT